MKTRSVLAGVMFLLLPNGGHAWTGDTWGSITRSTIQSIADQMIDSSWTPQSTFNNYEFTDNGTPVYWTYYSGTTYYGIAYGQGNPQDNWADFSYYVGVTGSGNKTYGNDCSGFVSICWKLPARNTTATFESGINGTYWSSLGNIGSASSVALLLGDALNSSSAGHQLMFLNYESSGIRSMEQTPHHAQRRVWSYSSLGVYRPIRRNQITGDGLPDLTIVEPVVVSPTSVAPGGMIRVDWTEKNNGTVASSPAHSTKISLSSSAYGTTYQLIKYAGMPAIGALSTRGQYDNIIVPMSIPSGDYYVTVFIDSDQQVSEGSNEGNNIGSSTPTRLTVGTTPPSKATTPNPANGSGGQSINVDVSWNNGGGATSYNIYFGTDSSPDSGELRGNQAGTSFDPGTLAHDTTYYRRIDAVNTAGTTTGDVWSFTTTLPNPPSAPTITSLKLTGTTFTLSVPTQVGFNYTLEYKNSFSDANWTAVQTISGTDGTITLTDTGAADTRRLYRVRVQ